MLKVKNIQKNTFRTVYLQLAKKIASPSMYAYYRFQHTLHAIGYFRLRHYTMSPNENEFK